MAIAYMEMPEEKTVMTAKEMALKAARLFIEAQLQVLGHRARLRAVVERHHEDAEEHHGRDGADPIEVAGHDAVLGAGRGHADDFLRAEIGREEGEARDPGGNGASGQEEVGAAVHVALEVET